MRLRHAGAGNDYTVSRYDSWRAHGTCGHVAVTNGREVWLAQVTHNGITGLRALDRALLPAEAIVATSFDGEHCVVSTGYVHDTSPSGSWRRTRNTISVIEPNNGSVLGSKVLNFRADNVGICAAHAFAWFWYAQDTCLGVDAPLRLDGAKSDYAPEEFLIFDTCDSFGLGDRLIMGSSARDTQFIIKDLGGTTARIPIPRRYSKRQERAVCGINQNNRPVLTIVRGSTEYESWTLQVDQTWSQCEKWTTRSQILTDFCGPDGRPVGIKRNHLPV